MPTIRWVTMLRNMDSISHQTIANLLRLSIILGRLERKIYLVNGRKFAQIASSLMRCLDQKEINKLLWLVGIRYQITERISLPKSGTRKLISPN